jgi:integrase
VASHQRGQVKKCADGTWAYRYRTPDGKRPQRGGYATKGEATKALTKALDENRTGRREPISLEALADEFLENHSGEDNTVKTLKARLKYATKGPTLDGKDALGSVRVDRLTGPQIIRWRNQLPERSRWHIVKALRQLLHYAVAEKMLDANPACEFKNEKPKRREVEILSREEVDAVAVELGTTLPVFVAETGLRPEEWLALERGDVDKKNMLVSVSKVFTDGRVKSHTKTGKPRLVPLSDRALEAYEGLPLRIDTRLVFPGERNEHMDLNAWRRNHWSPALRAAGLLHRSPYALRHTYISEALAAGVPARDVADVAGTSISQIEETYGHRTPDAFQRIREAQNSRETARLGHSLDTEISERP